jgi:hypothetical protein
VEAEAPLRGISNSLGAYRKLLGSAFAGASGVALLLGSVNYPSDGGPLLSDPEFREHFLDDLRRAFLSYLWGFEVLWTSSREIYDKHGGSQTFPEFSSRFPDKESGFPAFVFDLFTVVKRDDLPFSPRAVLRRWHESGRWLSLDFFARPEQLHSLRYTTRGATEYAMTLTDKVSLTELYSAFSDLMLGFGCWFESDLRRVVLMTMGRDPDPPDDPDDADSTVVFTPVDYIEWVVVLDEPRCEDTTAKIAQWRVEYDPEHWLSDDDIQVETFGNGNEPDGLTISVHNSAAYSLPSVRRTV